MCSPKAIDQIFQLAWKQYCAESSQNPYQWTSPDTKLFSELMLDLTPFAEGGEVGCQYNLALIFWFGLTCDSEEQYRGSYPQLIQEATKWWSAAAKQGYWPAVDNLATNGVGPDAERVREAWTSLEKEQADLVGEVHGLPIYGPRFTKELTLRLYGKVVDDEA